MIHTFQEDDGWSIWLDVDDENTERTGLCIGTGSSEFEARMDAINYLSWALEDLAAGRRETRPTAAPFVCRCCGMPGTPAMPDAHCCAACWEGWQERLEDRSPALSRAPLQVSAAVLPSSMPHPGAGLAVGSEYPNGTAAVQFTGEGPTISARPPAPSAGCIPPAALP